MMIRRKAELAAQDILTRTWLDADTYMTIPVDPVTIAKRLGVDVVETQLDPHVSGAIVKRPGEDPIIYLDRRDSNNRKRFTCAHELGHFVQQDQQEEFGYLDYRGPISSEGSNKAEIYSNAFAAQLLMPDWAVREIWPKAGSTVAGIAAQFGVSSEAMGHRLENLGFHWNLHE